MEGENVYNSQSTEESKRNRVRIYHRRHGIRRPINHRNTVLAIVSRHVDRVGDRIACNGRGTKCHYGDRAAGAVNHRLITVCRSYLDLIRHRVLSSRQQAPSPTVPSRAPTQPAMQAWSRQRGPVPCPPNTPRAPNSKSTHLHSPPRARTIAEGRIGAELGCDELT